MNHYERSALNFFAANPLDRLTLKRRDPAWIAAELQASTTRFVPLWQLQNLFASQDLAQVMLLELATAPELLAIAEPLLLGTYEGTTYFAIDVSSGDETALSSLRALGNFQDLRAAHPTLDGKTGAILAYAKAMAYWHQRHRFCGDCGSRTQSADGGFVRICTNAACAKQHFPRTDSAIITLVQAEDRCLLARQATWPAGRYSVIAGFVEPGESLEAAVVREVREETNITVTNVHYHSSQPWPFPGSLMLGYTAEASTFDLLCVDEELEQARWISRPEMVAEIRAGVLKLPPSVSISHRLIEFWFDAGDCGKLSDLLQPATPW